MFVTNGPPPPPRASRHGRATSSGASSACIHAWSRNPRGVVFKVNVGVNLTSLALSGSVSTSARTKCDSGYALDAAPNSGSISAQCVHQLAPNLTTTRESRFSHRTRWNASSPRTALRLPPRSGRDSRPGTDRMDSPPGGSDVIDARTALAASSCRSFSLLSDADVDATSAVGAGGRPKKRPRIVPPRRDEMCRAESDWRR
eukprot:19716-Pelagococcus_subviridis.AAC.2